MRSCRLTRRFWLAPFVILLSCQIAAADDDIAARFRREYPSAAAKIEGAYSKVKGHCTVTHIKSEDNKAQGYEIKATFALDHGFRKISMSRRTFAGQSLVDVVACFGSSTAFSLERRDAGTPYSISRSASDRETVEAIYFSKVGRYLETPYFLYVRKFSEYLGMPGFRIVTAETVSLDGKSLVRIGGECPEGTGGSLTRFTVILDPEALWAIRRFEYRPGYLPGALATCEAQYSVNASGIPVPVVLHCREITGATVDVVFNEFEFAGTDRREFSLASYNLPERLEASGRTGGSSPGGDQAIWTRGWLPWLIGLGVLCGILALIVRQLRRPQARGRSGTGSE